jgi:hypothetical protein
MPSKKTAPTKRDRLGNLLRLQHHMVERTSNYFVQLGNLAAQGSIEPREYIQEFFGLWSGILEEFGDWLKPRSELEPRRHVLPVAQIKYYPEKHPVSRVNHKMRSERGDFRFRVPVEVFDTYGETAEIELSTDGLVRTFDPKKPLRPALTLAPEQNVRIQPAKVRRDMRYLPEYKVFGVSSIVAPQETYEGVVWGTIKGRKGRFPVALIALEIV